MKEELNTRFGAEKVSVYKKISDSLEILLVKFEINNGPTSVLVTNGLSTYEMPVHEKYKGREYNELFFCIPRYWNLHEIDNPNRQWPVEWLEKLANHAIENQKWFGPGHTIQCYQDYKSLSDTMKQDHLMLIDPVLLKKEMAPIVSGEKTIYFLAVMPIYGDEMDFKQAKGTYKLLTKFLFKNYTENLDDYRETVLKSRMKLWR